MTPPSPPGPAAATAPCRWWSLTAGETGVSQLNPPEVNAELSILLANKQLAHAEFAALSTRGRQRAVPGSAHAIPHDVPQAVIDAIAEVVSEARAAARP